MTSSGHGFQSVREVARRLGMQEQDVLVLIMDGALEGSFIDDLRVVEEKSVDAYLSRQQRGEHEDLAGKQITRSEFAKKIASNVAYAGISGWMFFVCDKLILGDASKSDVAELFPSWHESWLVPGSHHPKQGLHPDVEQAANNLLPLFPKLHDARRLALDELPNPNFSDDLLLIGGPVSSALSMHVHGHRFHGTKISERPVRNTQLRWQFHYPSAKAADPKFLRYMNETLRPTMVKGIVDTKASGELAMPFYSRIDHDQRITSDYLLITVVRNRFAKISSGSTIIDIADLHGQGDKAFASIMDSSSARRELASALKGKKYFQALYEVRVKHDDSTRRTFPGAARLLDVAPV